MKRFLWIFLVLLVALPTRAQTQKPYPGVDLPNVWTEPNTFMQIIGTPTTFGGLGSPSGANSYSIRWISDSTSVTVQGQPCVGGGTEKALAFSNGTTWACFSVISGGSGGNQAVSFTNQTTVSVVAQGGTANVVWDCWDGQSPVAHTLLPSDVSINTLNFLMTFTFATPKSGFCVINSGKGGGGGGGGGGSILFQNNGTTLPFEPFANCVAPMLCADNPANTRIDISTPVAVGVGGSHASGLVPDPQAAGSTTDYLGRDMNYHTSTSAAAILPDPATAIQYVAGTCNGGSACTDANDGLSWGSAKLTIYTAACSLPQGNCGSQISGNGSIFVGPGAVSNPNGPTYGIWILGLGDPNFASPPTGWLKACNHGSSGCGVSQDTGKLTIIGVPDNSGSPNGHKPRILFSAGFDGTDRNKPAIWLSAVNQGLSFYNLSFQYPGRAFVMGECSDHTRTGTCPVVGVTFDNMGALLNQTAANGPCTDVTGQSFWLWFQDGFGCGGNAYNASGGYTANNAAAFFVDGSTNQGNGLIHIMDSNFAGGGVKFINGANGGSIYIHNITEEGDFTDQIPPAVWFTNYGAATDAILENIQIADAGAAGAPVVQNDGTINGVGPTVISTEGSSGIAIVGPAHVVNQPQFSLVNQTSSVLSQYQTGFYGPYVVGETDVARRIGGLTPIRFANTGIFSSPLGSPAPWAITSFSGVSTLTLNVTDPFGGTGAATASSTNPADEQVTFNSGNRPGGCTFYSPVSGDWIVISAWLKSVVVPAAGPTIIFSTCGGAPPTFSATHFMGNMVKGDGQWSFVWTAYKVTSGAGIGLNANVHFNGNTPVTIYSPTMNVIPVGTLSDNEVLEYASSMNSIDNACTVGSICNVTGHPVSADVFTERATAAPTGTAGITQHYMDSTANWPSFKPNGNTAYIVPGFTGAWTPGNCATATATTNVFNLGTCGSGGGGNVTNASQFSVGNYTAAGNSNVIGGIPVPTVPDNVMQFFGSQPSSGAVQAGFFLAGIPVKSDNNANYNVLAADRNGYVIETLGSPGTTFSVPSTLFTNGFAFKAGSRSLNGTVVITPSSGSCNGQTDGSTCTLAQGENAVVTLAPSGTDLLADIHDPPLTCVTGCTLTRNDYSLGLSVTGAVAGSGTVGSLVKFVTNTTTIGNGDLSGDCATAGTLVDLCTSLNGVAYPASPSTGTVPVVTGANTITYELVPAASIVGGGATTVNGQSCAVNATCDVNTGAANHTMALNGGAGAAVTGLALTNQQIPSGVTGADPVAYNLSELSATLDGGTAGGTVNALTACSTPAASTTLHTGQVIELKPSGSNTVGNPTLAWCGATAKTITSFNTTLASAGGTGSDLQSTNRALLLYNGTTFELQNPQTNKVGASVSWDVIGNALGNTTIANGAFTTTFTQTSNVAWVWNNITPAIIGTMQPSPTLSFGGQYCTVTVTCGSAQDIWRVRQALTTGVNAASTFIIEHAGGTSGTVQVQMPQLAVTNTVTAATVNDSGLTGSLPVCTDSSKNLSSTCTGLVTNADLANSAITIGGTSVSLGGSTTSFPAPGAIGGTTPNTGAFTTLSASTSITDSGLTVSLPVCTDASKVLSSTCTGLITGAMLTTALNKHSCEIVISGTGTSNVLVSGDDTAANNSCYNKTGATETITAVYCKNDHASNTTTINPTFGATGTGTTVLSGALTCGSSEAYSSTGTVSNASLLDGNGIDVVMGGTLIGTNIHVLVIYTLP